MEKLDGIHHISSITADATKNLLFYEGVMGLRLVKKTVNQDNPSVYHLFYADEDGSPGADGELDGYRVPNELPIHVETMLADPRHRAVAHLHPPAVVAADLAGITIRPIYGAYDIPGAWLARGGVPVYERAALIRNTRLGKEMVAAMGSAPVVICRGHGITSAAATVQQAVLQAISLDALARMSLQIRAAGGTLRDIDDADWQELPDLGSGFTTDAAWRSEVARLPADDAERAAR